MHPDNGVYDKQCFTRRCSALPHRPPARRILRPMPIGPRHGPGVAWPLCASGMGARPRTMACRASDAAGFTLVSYSHYADLLATSLVSVGLPLASPRKPRATCSTLLPHGQTDDQVHHSFFMGHRPTMNILICCWCWMLFLFWCGCAVADIMKLAVALVLVGGGVGAHGAG